jgi:hypothetical protein
LIFVIMRRLLIYMLLSLNSSRSIKERLLMLLNDLNPLKVKPLEIFKILVIS